MNPLFPEFLAPGIRGFLDLDTTLVHLLWVETGTADDLVISDLNRNSGLKSAVR
jgi:hypothetical protein